MRIFYVIVYYTVALVAVVSAVRAKSVVMRALPMLVLIPYPLQLAIPPGWSAVHIAFI